MTYKPDTDTASVFATLIGQGGLGIAFYLIFELCRGQKEIYQPRLRSRPSRCPPELPAGIGAWIQPILRITDEETLRYVGVDGFMFLRFLRLGAKVGIGCGFFGLIFLVPIYATARKIDEVEGIKRCSMANVRDGGDRLWAPLLVAWVYTLILLYLLYKEYEFFVTMRQKFLRDGDPNIPPQQFYSVIVENIPTEFRSSKGLGILFNRLFPDQIASTRIAMNFTPILKAAQERKIYIINLEKSVAAFEASDKEKTPVVKLDKKGKPIMCCGGREVVEAIPYFKEKLRAMNEKVLQLKCQAAAVDEAATVEVPEVTVECKKANLHKGDNDLENNLLSASTEGDTEGTSDEKSKEINHENFTANSISSSGFVTFRSRRAQAAAYQLSLLSDKYPLLKAFQAQSTRNILWYNTNVSLDYIQFAMMLTSVAYSVGIVFWGLILAGISAISSLSSVMVVLPFLADAPTAVQAIIAGQLPVIVLIVFIALIPTIMTAVSCYVERQKTMTDVQIQVCKWFFGYQLANVYLLLFTGSMFGAISEAITNPPSIFTLLGKSIAGFSVFFMNLTLTMLLSGPSLSLLRLVPLLIYKLYLGCFNKKTLTRRTLLEGPLADNDINYGTTIPGELYVFCIALLYWVISPIILPICGMIFAAHYLVYKYQLLYVIVPSNETGGAFFYKMFNFTMSGLMFSTVTLIAYMAIRLCKATPILIPLPFIILIVWRFTEQRFKLLTMNMAHSRAIDADATDSDEFIKTFSDDFFIPPDLSGPATLHPEPYRINEVPLIDEHGFLAAEYYELKEVLDNPLFEEKKQQKDIEEAVEDVTEVAAAVEVMSPAELN